MAKLFQRSQEGTAKGARGWLGGAVAAGVAVATVAAAAVGPAGATTVRHVRTATFPKYTKKVSLNVWSFAPASSMKVLIHNFEHLYPSITVHTEDVGGGGSTGAEYSKLLTAINAGSGAPDVALVEYDYLPEFVASKGLANIAPYVDRYKSFVPKWAWSEVSFKGGVYMFPNGGGTMGMVYVPKLLTKYHLPIPTTYAQYATDAVKLHKLDPKAYMTYFPVNDGGYQEALMQQAGAQPFALSKNGTWTIDLTSPAIERELNYWGHLVKVGAVEAVDDFTPAWEHGITSGSFATYMGASWMPSYAIAPYVKPGTQTFSVTHMPYWKAGQPVDANWGGSGYVVTAQSKHPHAAALFTAYADLGMINQSELLGNVPVATTSNKYPAFQHGTVKYFGKANLNAVFFNFAKYVSPTFQFSPWTTLLGNDLETQLQSALQGKQSFDKALQNTQNELVSYAQAQGYSVVGK